MTNIALFASGSGTNAQRIIEYFQNSSDIRVKVLYSNNKESYALERAKNLGVAGKVFDRKTFYETDQIIQDLQKEQISWIILAGFLWLIPPNLIRAFPDRIINIHPALLPLYGGKGMYGNFVHKAVAAAKDTQTGISIHFVNEKYDEGKILFQATCTVDPADTPEMIARKVQVLEHRHFPEVIEETIKKSILK